MAAPTPLSCQSVWPPSPCPSTLSPPPPPLPSPKCRCALLAESSDQRVFVTSNRDCLPTPCPPGCGFRPIPRRRLPPAPAVEAPPIPSRVMPHHCVLHPLQWLLAHPSTPQPLNPLIPPHSPHSPLHPLQWLLAEGADVNPIDRFKRTPLEVGEEDRRGWWMWGPGGEVREEMSVGARRRGSLARKGPEPSRGLGICSNMQGGESPAGRALLTGRGRVPPCSDAA